MLSRTFRGWPFIVCHFTAICMQEFDCMQGYLMSSYVLYSSLVVLCVFIVILSAVFLRKKRITERARRMWWYVNKSKKEKSSFSDKDQFCLWWLSFNAFYILSVVSTRKTVRFSSLIMTAITFMFTGKTGGIVVAFHALLKVCSKSSTEQHVWTVFYFCFFKIRNYSLNSIDIGIFLWFSLLKKITAGLATSISRDQGSQTRKVENHCQTPSFGNNSVLHHSIFNFHLQVPAVVCTPSMSNLHIIRQWTLDIMNIQSGS